jgi:hypothetical protein
LRLSFADVMPLIDMNITRESVLGGADETAGREENAA